MHRRVTTYTRARRLPGVGLAVLSLVVTAAVLARAQSAPAPGAVVTLENLENAFTQVADSVSGSVVAIRVEARRKLNNPLGGLPFGEWFGLPEGRERYQIQRGTGSGVVIRADGYILTNKHVVENTSHVEVVFRDGSRFQGKTVGVDDATDLAVVRVEQKRLNAARFADSDRAKPGQWVIAIGSPFGLDYTVTVGVLSAVGRGGMHANEIEDYLQTDASINPGNSGGPLVNLRGEVLGINTMIVGQGTGIGFAIPSNLARMVADQLIDEGVVHRAYIGVGFQELTPDLAAQFGVQGRGGALVSSVAPDGPADRAGVKAGDVIVSVDGLAVVESRDLMRALLQKTVGAKLTVGVVRDKKERSLPVTAVERPGKRPRPRPEPKPTSRAEDLGLDLEPLTRQLARRLGYANAQGALVANIKRGSPADRAGLSEGDLIVEADRKPVQAPADVLAALSDGSALLRVRRGDDASFVMLTRE
jgi:Do/DeqQ family serine protease